MTGTELHFTNITAGIIAHQILVSGKVKRIKGNIKNKITRKTRQVNNFLELTYAIKILKSGKTAGFNNIHSELLKNFGPAARECLFSFSTSVQNK